MASIEARVKRIIADHLGIDEAQFDDETSLVDELGADSLDAIQLVTALEEEFDTEISDADAVCITSVRRAVELMTRASASGYAGQETLPPGLCNRA